MIDNTLYSHQLRFPSLQQVTPNLYLHLGIGRFSWCFYVFNVGQNAAPCNVSVSGMPMPNLNAVSVSWVPNLLPNIVLSGYDIEVCHGSCRTVHTNSISNTATVRGLDPHTVYSFRVTARNEIGVGNWSEPYLYKTQGMIECILCYATGQDVV